MSFPCRVRKTTRWVDAHYPHFVLVVKSWAFVGHLRKVMVTLDVTYQGEVLGKVRIPISELETNVHRFHPTR